MPPVYANRLAPSVAQGVRTQGFLAVTELGHQDSDSKTLSAETTNAANLESSDLQRQTSASEQRPAAPDISDRTATCSARHQRPSSDLQRQTSATEQRAIGADNQSGAVATRLRCFHGQHSAPSNSPEPPTLPTGAMPCCPDSADVAADVSPAAAVVVDYLRRCGRSMLTVLTDRLIDAQFPGIQPVSRVCPALQRTVQFGRSYVVTVWSLLRGHSLVTTMVTVQCAVYDCGHTPREGADDIADLTTIRPV